MLDCTEIGVRYGPIQALHEVSVHVSHGSIVSIIGANGAGKTSLLRAIMGLERATSGSIRFGDEDITNRRTHQITRIGMSFVPAGGELFANLTVLENLRLGASRLGGTDRRTLVQAQLDAAFRLFPVLASRARQKVRTMSGGEQQMVAIARALMVRPSLLLLDEPSFGLAPMVLDDILTTLRRLNAQTGLTILLVEQNARLALDFAEFAYILANGRVADYGRTADIRGQSGTAAIYFGGDPSEQ
jgi:branched-chain amino acid transport system ATP-binding protein